MNIYYYRCNLKLYEFTLVIILSNRLTTEFLTLSSDSFALNVIIVKFLSVKNIFDNISLHSNIFRNLFDSSNFAYLNKLRVLLVTLCLFNRKSIKNES
jgi:hypothetical protein